MLDDLKINDDADSKILTQDLSKYADLFMVNTEVNSVLSSFKYTPPEETVSIREGLEKVGVVLNDPNHIRFVSSVMKHRVFEDSILFNTDIVTKIDVNRIKDGHFRLTIFGKDSNGDESLVDFEVGENTTPIRNIPPNWLLRK